MLGGKSIELESRSGFGAVFSFVLPVTLAKTVSMPVFNGGDEKRLSLRHISVLVAEDWELNRHLLEQILHQLEISDITFVYNGVQAVEAVSQREFSLILMDLQMPVMGGIEAARKIRRKGISTPILALTAHAMKEDQKHCMNAGMNDYLSKPYKIEDIARAIHKFV